ncbi:sulfatase [Amaricoccus sp.]|uniref:sulfatase n=1 Tax=Amaricoccus sp. TaxID=1872485 RepID=UPI001B51C7FD|nr:sulfatase [Amaricoccus sp.]MBP7002813.1 sulfatase [Amaricoccus sp.]
MPAPDRPRPAALLAGAGALYLALALPNHPGAATWGALAVFPLELPLLIMALALASGRAATALRALTAAALTAMVVVKLADLAAHLAFGRASNPAFDLPLLAAGFRLAHGSLGAPAAITLAAGLVAGILLLAALLWRATGPLAALRPPPRLRLPATLAAVAALALVAADAAPKAIPLDPPGAAFTTRLAREHLADALRARRDLAEFRAAAAQDPAAAAPPDATLAALAGHDVFLIFVESYGRIALDAPEIAATVVPTLRDIAAALPARGLAARSGYVASPIVGGQSWLAHATALSGLAVDSEARYRALTASPRRTLLHLAAAAGWRTLGVMPAITLAWPEGAWFGYDRVLASADLGYGGAAFGWMAMPDQFTLAALERAELDRPGRPPVFAEVALVSSHAPWTPVPRLVPWDALGDGAIFAAQASEGPSPEAVWRDPATLRAQYGRTIAYSLGAVGGFALRRPPPAPVLIILGDHQPTPLLTGPGAGRDVPVHVIGPPDLVERLAAWGWAPGMIPDPAAPPMAMADLRDRLLGAFTESPPALVSGR